MNYRLTKSKFIMGLQCRSPYDCPFCRYCEGKVETQLELVGM